MTHRFIERSSSLGLLLGYFRVFGQVCQRSKDCSGVSRREIPIDYALRQRENIPGSSEASVGSTPRRFQLRGVFSFASKLVPVGKEEIEGEGFKSLSEGEEVTFDVIDSPKGPKATHIVKAVHKAA
jgi:hypothetical protein